MQVSKKFKKDVRIHSVPFKVKKDGAANVSGYFDPHVERIDDANVEAYSARFRGRELAGITVQLPRGFVGLVVEEQPRGENELDKGKEEKEKQPSSSSSRKRQRVVDERSDGAASTKRHNVVGSFQSFYFWQREQVPSRNSDAVELIEGWLPLNAALHERVDVNSIRSFDLNSIRLPTSCIEQETYSEKEQEEDEQQLLRDSDEDIL
jgi:Ribonuclease H2 non-catalytic subunit (Ylr154p-like)